MSSAASCVSGLPRKVDMGAGSGLMGISADMERQLCFCRMHSAKLPKRGVSYDTMHRYWHTWSLNAHPCRQSRPALQVGSVTQSTISCLHCVSMHRRLARSDPLVVMYTSLTGVTYSLMSTRKTNSRSSLVWRRHRSLIVPNRWAALAWGVKERNWAARDAMGLLSPRGAQPCSALSASSALPRSSPAPPTGAAASAGRNRRAGGSWPCCSARCSAAMRGGLDTPTPSSTCAEDMRCVRCALASGPPPASSASVTGSSWKEGSAHSRR
mmetsp:Transcript_788/g.2116  ORF Transcript_788/g.2116 Transcript_788/m.2116 type:complete len:268 (+) Transcript_788:859-1662(+)